MTETEQAVADAQAIWAAHFKQMDALIEEFIGKSQWDRRDTMPDPWFKSMFYVERIKHLMWNKGQIDHRLRRFKSTESEEYKRLDKRARDMELCADHIASILMEHSREIHKPKTTKKKKK